MLKRPSARYFVCPVCHFQMSWNDREQGDVIVCPVCGAVLTLADSAGFIIPVVSDMEIERYQPRLRLHPVSVAFPLVLFSTSLLLSLISVIVRSPWLDNGGILFLALGVLTAPVAFVSGLFDWLKKYKGRPYLITRQKIGFSIAFLCLGILCLVWRVLTPQLLTGETLFKWLYLATLLVLFSLGVALGHLGGRLVYGK